MDRNKFGAIKYQIRIGKRLIREHPEITEMYEDHTYQELVEKLNISDKYSINPIDAIKAVAFAISGFSGGFGLSSYKGLLSEEEKERIKKEHLKKANVIKIGCSHHKNLEAIAEAGRRGAITRGQIPWYLESDNKISEKQRAYELYESGMHYSKVANILNEEYHNGKNVRDKNKIKKAMFKYRKKLNSID